MTSTAGQRRDAVTDVAGAAAPEVVADEVFRRRANWLIVTVAVYAGASLVANVMSVRVVTVFGWSIDAGTLTYPLTFTVRDLIHKVGGKAAARTAILVTAALNGAMTLCFWAAAKLPADLAVGPQREFGDVLIQTWRIVAASLLAQVVAELLDTEVYQRFVDRYGHSAQWGRVLSSNAVSVPIDSVLFTLVAFGGESAETVREIIVANIVVKGVSSLVTAPVIYAVPEFGTAPDDD